MLCILSCQPLSARWPVSTDRTRKGTKERSGLAFSGKFRRIGACLGRKRRALYRYMQTHKNTSRKMLSSKSRLGALASAGIVVAALAFSGCSSNKSESASEKILSSSEVIALMKTPLTEATSITMTTDDGDNGDAASVTVRRDALGDLEFKTGGDTGLDAAKSIVLASGKVYMQFKDEALDDVDALQGLSSDEWVMFGSAGDLDESGISADIIDDAVVGSESVSDGVYQLSDALDANYEGWDQYVVVSTEKDQLSRGVLYDLAPSATETVSLQVGVDSKGRLAFVGLGEQDGSWSTTLKVSYDESDVAAPEKVSDISPSVVQEALMDAAASDMAQNSALSFDRQIRSMAAFGIDGNPNDTDPRRSQLLIDMISTNGAGSIQDIPDSSTASSVLEKSQLRVLVWQGAGAASVKWTRLFCEPSACQNLVSEQLLSSVGENGKLFNPSPRQEVCIQFHKFGKDTWLSLSTRANQQGIVSNVLQEACPSSSFPGIVAATGTTYADLAVSSTGAATDSSW